MSRFSLSGEPPHLERRVASPFNPLRASYRTLPKRRTRPVCCWSIRYPRESVLQIRYKIVEGFKSDGDAQQTLARLGLRSHQSMS